MRTMNITLVGTPNRAARFFAAALAVTALACGPGPTSPGASPGDLSKVTPLVRTLRVVSGWDDSPVGGAQVRVGDVLLTADFSARMTVPVAVPLDAPVDIDVPGFLPYRARLSDVIGAGLARLWPVGSDPEADAIRAMAFYPTRSGDYVLSRLPWDIYQLTLLVTGTGRSPDEVSAEWTGEYQEIKQLTGLGLLVSFAPHGDHPTDAFENEVIVAFDGTRESCADAWGFCPFFDTSLPYFSRPVRIVKDVASRPDVIRRVLVAGLLSPNPLPGLLNKSAPAAELSMLEKQTLRMLHLRPSGTRWPDTAPSR